MKENIAIVTSCLSLVLVLTGCDSLLDTTAYSELTEESILTSQDGINAVLNDAYAELRDPYFFHLWGSDIPAGLAWSRGGSIEADFVDYENFTWNTTHAQITGFWASQFESIRNANLVLASIDEADLGDEFVQQKTGEARFLRGLSYYMLYQAFGPTPLVTQPGELRLPRASAEEMRAFIESDLRTAADNLNPATAAFGRATIGSALGILTKFYLNTRQWDKAANTAQEVVDLQQYRLLDNYADVFSFEHAGNEELLFAIPYNAAGASHFINAITFPTDYPLPYPSNAVFAAETYLFDDFVDSFEAEDARKTLIVTDYENRSGENITLHGNDMSIPGKYPFDPNSQGQFEGSDIPVVRYADILLARAEALNELSGPIPEAIDLINQVRERAGASQVSVSDFTQQSLREFILEERHREFFFEGKAREDQIRQEVFISKAQARGVSAQPRHTVFPIPQVEIDANPEMMQNQGY